MAKFDPFKCPNCRGARPTPAYMLTFGDMNNLLVGMLIVLLCILKMPVPEGRIKITAMLLNMGIMPRSISVLNAKELAVSKKGTFKILKKQEEMKKVEEKIKQQMQEQLQEKKVTIVGKEKEIVLQWMADSYFDLGKADLKPSFKENLDAIAKIIKDKPYYIRIEGHTDDIPIHTAEFPSNWELSAKRAINILRYFQEVHGISPKRLFAVGYGEHYPKEPNAPGKKGNPKNRRVDIRITTTKEEAESSQRGIFGEGNF